MLVERGMWQRRACRYLGVCRKTVRYVKRPEDPTNTLIREELRKLSQRHRRYGTPRMTELIRRAGYRANHKRIERLWKLEGLPLSMKRLRKRMKGTTSEQRLKATRANDVWSYGYHP